MLLKISVVRDVSMVCVLCHIVRSYKEGIVRSEWVGETVSEKWRSQKVGTLISMVNYS